MFKRVDFRAVIFHEASGYAAVTEVLWFPLSKETSPLIVVIHHFQQANMEIIRPVFRFFFFLKMRSAQM